MTPAPPTPATILERRLADGRRRIEDAQQRGIDIRAWEAWWYQLLEEYEAIRIHLDNLSQGQHDEHP